MSQFPEDALETMLRVVARVSDPENISRLAPQVIHKHETQEFGRGLKIYIT